MFVRLKRLYLLFEKSEDRAKTRVIITARVSGDMVTQGNNSIDYAISLQLKVIAKPHKKPMYRFLWFLQPLLFSFRSER